MLLLLLSPTLLWAQHTVSGTITDQSTGETLIGATVLDTRSGKGTITNSNGRYTLTLKGNEALLRITFVGYEPTHQLTRIVSNECSRNARRTTQGCACPLW